ncbi:hypothetical protein V2J09_010803 [Rumex salicifolius]
MTTSTGEQPTAPPPAAAPLPSESDSEMDSLPRLEEAEVIIGYKFNNRRLLEEALTHHSHPSGTENFNYERLEYVGDSVLNLLVTKEQYYLYPNLPPGALTRLRSANVNTEKLARVAVKLGLHKFLRHRKPLLAKQIAAFCQEIEKYPLHSNWLVDAPKVLADIVESTIGAVFIDSDRSLDTVWTVFKVLLEPNIGPQTIGIHPVTELMELCQKKRWNVEFRDLWRESTAYNVFIQGQFVGSAAYALKKEIAYNRAAKDALDHIDQVIGDPEGVSAVNSVDAELSENDIGLALHDLRIDAT